MYAIEEVMREDLEKAAIVERGGEAEETGKKEGHRDTLLRFFHQVKGK